MSWRHIEDKDVKARKDHRCWLCAETIDKGTTYRRRVGIGDDGPMTMHMHAECEAATRDWDQMDWEVTCFGSGIDRNVLGNG